MTTAEENLALSKLIHAGVTETMSAVVSERCMQVSRKYRVFTDNSKVKSLLFKLFSSLLVRWPRTVHSLEIYRSGHLLSPTVIEEGRLVSE